MSATCPTHGVAWKTVPAGISSKTGQPYNSFRACPVKGCQERPPRNAAQAAPDPWAAPAPAQSQALPQTSFSVDPRRSQAMLAVACLNFAATVFQGTAQAEEAKTLASEVYEAWKGKV